MMGVTAAVEIDREEGGFMFSWRILVVVGSDCRVGGVSWILVGGEIWNLDLRAMFWGSELGVYREQQFPL